MVIRERSRTQLRGSPYHGSTQKLDIVEKNVIHKKYRPGVLRVAIAYPSTYQVAMSSLSIHLLYHYLNSIDFIIAERVVMEGCGPYRSIESGTYLSKFDIVLFSVHYELDYVNIVRMLEESGIPALRARRGEEYPIIAVGGPCITANPEPLAEIVDLAFIGEAEPVLHKVLEKIYEYKDSKQWKDSVASIEGVYIPDLVNNSNFVTKAIAKPLDHYEYPTRQIVTLEAPERYTPVFGKAFYLEVVRGCPFLCCFCMETLVQFPFRFRSFNIIKQIVEEGLEHCPVDKIVIIGLAFQSHPECKKILEFLLNNFDISISLPSMRADLLDDDMLNLLVQCRQQTLTVAPESSERIRLALGKDFSDSDVIELAKRAEKVGIKELKLYFIIGLPGETEKDLDEIVKLVNTIKRETNLEIYVNVNPWVRKPHTPLQYEVPLDLESVSKRIDYVVDKLGVRHVVYDPYLAYAQMLLSLGDRSIGRVLVEISKLSGSNLSRAFWRRVFSRYPSVLKSIVFRNFRPGEDVPWRLIKLGLSDYTIVRKWERYITQVK